MNLAEFFNPELIITDLKAESKQEAVERLTDLFCARFPDKDKQAILQAVAEREEIGSTSFGRGFAFPHARTDSVRDLYIAIGIIRDGVHDKTPDNFPIKVICLLLTPRNIARLYLQTLSGLANFARRPGILDRVMSATDPQALIEIFRNEAIEVRAGLTVGDIMTRDVVTVLPDDSLKKVANIMFKFSFDGVPVVDYGKRLVGDISSRDLLKAALPNYENLIVNRPELEPFENLLRQQDRLHVGDIMRRDFAAISETASVLEAAAMMLVRNTERIMVVNDSKLIGIISATNIFSKIIRG